jgi:hypothetical protein
VRTGVLSLRRKPEPVYNSEIEGNYWRRIGWGLLVLNAGVASGFIEEEIGAHYTSNPAALLILSSKKLNAMSWVQPFPATPEGIDRLKAFLLGGGSGTGAVGTDQTLIFDIRGFEVSPGGIDVNGGIKLQDEVPLARLIAQVDDAGHPDKVDEALAKVKAYFGIP